MRRPASFDHRGTIFVDAEIPRANPDGHHKDPGQYGYRDNLDVSGTISGSDGLGHCSLALVEGVIWIGMSETSDVADGIAT
jgi:hypothetical protein